MSFSLDRGDIASALNVILTDCPYGEDVDEAKVCECYLVVKVEHC